MGRKAASASSSRVPRVVQGLAAFAYQVCAVARQRARWCWAAAVPRRAVLTPARVPWGGQWSKPAAPVATPTQKVRLYAGIDPRDPSADIAYACTVRAVHGAGGNGIPASRAKSRGQGVVSLGFILSGLWWDAAGSMTLARGGWRADVICVCLCVCVCNIGSWRADALPHTHTHKTHATTHARMHAYIHAHMHACMHACIHTYM